MELYQLKAFAMVAEQGNVTRAADRLHASQPAVSAQIKALEAHLGVTLFARTPSGMRLTDAGEKLLPAARATLEQSSAMEQLAARMHSGTAGSLRLGANNPADRLRLDELAGALIARHPSMALHIETGPSGAVLEGLVDHRLDAGFIEGPLTDARVHGRLIGRSEVCIVAPTAWADALPEGDWDALQAFPWVFVSTQCSYHRLMERFIRERGLTLRQSFLSDHDTTTLHLVRQGVAMSVTDRRSAELAAAAGEVYIWPGFGQSLDLRLCALHRRAEEPLIRAFLDVAMGVYQTPASAVAG